jgi:hypothetical protein
MRSYESGWVQVSRTTRPLLGNMVQVRLQLDTEVKKMLQNQRPRAVGGESVEVVADEDFMGLYPHLWTYLTQMTWEDGTARLPSPVTIFVQHGKWTACLTEKNWGLILFATADRVEGLWEALDARLGDPKADWRADRKVPGQQAKRVQKPS